MKNRTEVEDDPVEKLYVDLKIGIAKLIYSSHLTAENILVLLCELLGIICGEEEEPEGAINRACSYLQVFRKQYKDRSPSSVDPYADPSLFLDPNEVK